MQKITLQKNKKSGFTLIELLLVLAIIIILSGVILISVSAQRQKAKQTKVLTELSGTLQQITMCHSDEGDVTGPSGSGGGDICSWGSSYGQWPTASDDFNSFVSDSNFNDGDWFISISDTGNNVTICCNSTYSKCGRLTSGVCDATTALE